MNRDLTRKAAVQVDSATAAFSVEK